MKRIYNTIIALFMIFGCCISLIPEAVYADAYYDMGDVGYYAYEMLYPADEVTIMRYLIFQMNPPLPAIDSNKVTYNFTCSLEDM